METAACTESALKASETATRVDDELETILKKQKDKKWGASCDASILG